MAELKGKYKGSLKLVTERIRTFVKINREERHEYLLAVVTERIRTSVLISQIGGCIFGHLNWLICGLNW